MGWPNPDVKPGVVALRPLGAGEIVDGAITTVRKNPLATIGLAAIVGVVTSLIGLAASWLISRQDAFADPAPTTDEIVDALAVTLPVLGLELLVVWLATVFLTGLLTVVVGQAVIGRNLTIAEAWQKARPRMWRLLGLTMVYTLIWLGTFVGIIIVAAILGALIGDAGGVVIVFLGLLVATIVSIWLYVRFALAVPSLMLESEQYGSTARPVRLGRALSRSAGLVRGSWWRTFGILLMITIIGAIVSYAVNIPFQMLAGVAMTDPTTVVDMSFGALALASVGQIIATAIAAPFVAAATVLLYIDLRIRREGLDLELARAAGVSLPGRAGPPQAAYVQHQPWTSPPAGQPPAGPPPAGQPPAGPPPAGMPSAGPPPGGPGTIPPERPTNPPPGSGPSAP